MFSTYAVKQENEQFSFALGFFYKIDELFARFTIDHIRIKIVGIDFFHFLHTGTHRSGARKVIFEVVHKLHTAHFGIAAGKGERPLFFSVHRFKQGIG